MPTNELKVISLLPESGRTEPIARQWAVTFAELFCMSLAERGPRFVDLWVSALADLPPEVLDAACRRAMRTCKFFPAAAEIRALVENVALTAGKAEANDAWHFALDHCSRFYHPDLGVSRNAPMLPPRIERAIRDAGGLHWIQTCPEDQLPWAKRAFIASLENSDELVRVADLLPAGAEAKKVLRQLTEKQLEPRRQLGPIAAPAAEPPASDDSIRADLAALRERLHRPEPKRELTEAEFNARKELLKRQAAQILNAERKTT